MTNTKRKKITNARPLDAAALQAISGGCGISFCGNVQFSGCGCRCS